MTCTETRIRPLGEIVRYYIERLGDRATQTTLTAALQAHREPFGVTFRLHTIFLCLDQMQDAGEIYRDDAGVFRIAAGARK